MTRSDTQSPATLSSSSATLSQSPSLSTLNTTNTSLTDRQLPALNSKANGRKWLGNLRGLRLGSKDGVSKENLQKRAVLGASTGSPKQTALTDVDRLPSLTSNSASEFSLSSDGAAAKMTEDHGQTLRTSDRICSLIMAQDKELNSMHDLLEGPSANEEISIEDDAQPEVFTGLTTQIPTSSLDELSSPDKIKFSARGSMLVDGNRLMKMAGGMPRSPERKREPRIQKTPPRSRSALSSRTPTKPLSSDEINLSQKVRAMYEFGGETRLEGVEEQPIVEEEEGNLDLNSLRVQSPEPRPARPVPSRSTSRRTSFIDRPSYEVAGGIEDWEDVGGGQVDRYGFIMPKESRSTLANGVESRFDSPSGIQRTSTILQDISSSPRPKNSLRRRLSRAKSEHSTATRSHGIGFLGRAATQSNGSIATSHHTSYSNFSSAASPLRRATNRLPHNRQRRLLDEASDMLTLPPGLADLAEEQDNGKTALGMKRKEWKREDKWRKMGRALPPPPIPEASVLPNRDARRSKQKGGGMLFDFNPNDPKIASRTWKGIPDRWRASAWYSFLSHSYNHHKIGQSDTELVDFFHEAQDEPCADDVQIDCDVPRTINRHIMFRRRYRGGQRLLFRVLHAIALFAPDVGYVQGMAAIAATLLCYFDEEKAFICMARLWQLRGLQTLFANGFGGLMSALENFETAWMGQGDVGKKLVSSR